MARMNIWWMGVKNWLKASGTPAKRRSISHRRWIGLEILEERAVPAIITVTNLLDGTNPTSPLPGSLREAVKVLAKPGDEIQFDQALFASGTPQTLTLNGAVGALQIERNNITIVGPGKFTSGAFAGTYKLTIQADYGFQDTIQVANGGSGYRVGDLIQQGSTLDKGGARFQVLSINDPSNLGKGPVTAVRVVNPGANTGFTGYLSTTLTGLNNLAPVGAVTGTGLELAPNAGNIGLASGLIYSQLVTANPQNFAVSGLHFGDSKFAAIYQNLGNLSVDDCLFDQSVGTGAYIQTSNFSGSITVTNSLFDSKVSGVAGHIELNGSGFLNVANSTFLYGAGQISYSGRSTVTIANSDFSNAAGGYAFSGSGSSLTITDSKFHDGTNGVIFNSGGKATVDNSYFYKTTNGGLTLNGSSTRVTNSYFANNSRGSGVQVLNQLNLTYGGAAIFSFGTGSLTVRKSVFQKNTVDNIQNFRSGGGAIYNEKGSFTLDLCEFEENGINFSAYPIADPDPTQNDPDYFSLNPENMPSAANSGGGAVYSGGKENDISSSLFNKNYVTSQIDFWAYTATPSDGSTAKMSLPQYGGGGAVYLTNNDTSSDTKLKNSTFYQNSVTFQNPVPNPYVTPSVKAIASGDFNKDGKQDLLVGTSFDSANIEIRLGTGPGTFGSPVALLSAPASISAITTGDFNNDGWLDFAVGSKVQSGNNLFIFYNSKSSPVPSFSVTSFSAGNQISALATGDLNLDGKMDLVVGTYSTPSNLYLAMNTGSSFSVRPPFSVGANSINPTVSLCVADMTSDGRPDIVMVSEATLENVHVLENNSSSGLNVNFSRFTSSAVSGIYPTGIAAGEFDSIPGKDLVYLTNEATAGFKVLLNYTSSTFSTAQWTNYSYGGSGTPDHPNSLVVGDFNQDGLDELAITVLQDFSTDTGRVIIALPSSSGVFLFNNYVVGKKCFDIAISPSNSNPNVLNLVVGCASSTNNIFFGTNSGGGIFNFSRRYSTQGTISSGAGLNGGAIIIATGVNSASLNTVQERSFSGSITAEFANNTITQNTFINRLASPNNSNLDSNYRTVQSYGSGYSNVTDTGGIFSNTSSGSSVSLTNTININNIGIVYSLGRAFVDYSNTGRRFSSGNPGLFGSSQQFGHNLLGPSNNFGFSFPYIGDLIIAENSPVFDLLGLQDNLAITIGLLNPSPVLPNSGQGKVQTLALDRLSPARDSGNDSVFSSSSPSPVQLNYDGRGVLRKINLAVDIGAYEVQTGTATVIANPKLQPADSTHPNPFFVTDYGLTTDITVAVQWNDVLPPSGVISGTVQLVSQPDPTQVIATGTVVGDPNDVNAGGLASISLNVAGLPPTLLNTGLNNFLLIYSGDPTWAPSQSNPFSVEVIPSTTTTTLLSGSPPAQIPNGLVNFSGTVSANSIIIPQGPITLRARKLPGGGSPVGSWADIATSTLDPLGNFTFSNVKFATPGNYEVQAIYSSTTPSQFTSSTSTSVVQEIGYYFTAAAPFSAFSVDPITRAGTPVSTVERGDSVTLKATARFNAADGLPLGTVQFLTPAGTVIGSGTGNLVAPGQMEYTLANIDPTMLPLGSSQIIASYTRQWTTAGDPYLSMNTLNSQPLTITSIATTTSLTAAPASLIYGNNLLLTATVSPTKAGVNFKPGTIDFYSGTLKLASVPVTGNSPTATLNTKTLAPGSYYITAVYSGDGLNYGASSSAPRTVVVDKASTALAISVTPPATVTIPNQVTITASLTNNAGPGAAKPSGLIYLYRNGVTLANWDLSQSGTPTFTDTPYVAGNYTYELRYTGDVNYQAASPVSQVVQAIVSPVTTTTLQVSANSTVYGTPLVFTANVAPAAGVAYQPGRKVKFEAWNGPTLVNLGESTLGLNTNGWPLPVEITSSSLPAGNWDIKALYEGDGPGGYYLPSTSVPVPLTVTKAATSLSLAISGTYVDGRAAVPFTMTLKNDAQVPSLPPSGSIMVMANGNTIRTLPVTPGLTTYTVSDWIPGTAGTFNLVASYSGDNNYQTANATGQVTTYLKTNTQTGVTVVPASTTYGNSVLLTANVTPAGLPAGGQVQFYVNGVALGAAQTLDANQKASLTTTTLDVGAQSITAKYLGRPPEYLESISAPAVVTVAKAATSMTLIPSGDLIPTGTPVTLTATLSESVSPPALDPVGNIEFWVDGVSMGSAPIIKGVATYTVTPQIPKTYLYEAKYAGSGTYLASAASTKVTAYQGALEKYYVVAPQVGSGLYIYDRVTNRQTAVLYPLGPSYSGGFTVTRGDINGDGVSDIVFSGRNTGLLQAIDGNDFTLIGSASPFGAAARFPLSIAVGDVNGDGKGDLIAAPAGIGMPPHVVAISGKDFRKTLFSQYAYSAQFRGGVSVAAGEVNGDGVADIITAPLVGAPPHIVTFNGASGKVLQSYYAYSQQYMGGTSIVASDLDNDGFVEIITGASAAAPHIVIVDSRTQKVKASFYAFEPGFAGGLRVSAVQDINGDGIKDILVAPGAGAPPNILRLDGKKALQNQSVVLDSFFAYGFADPSTNYYGGAFVG